MARSCYAPAGLVLELKTSLVPMPDTAHQQLRPLYRGTYVFGVACGISLALTPLVLAGAGFSKEQMGTLALFFAAGLVLFSLPAGKLLSRFGAKRVLSLALAGYAVCVAVFPLMSDYWSIATVRFFDGACSICIWVGSETVVLARSDPKRKAHLTSLYAIWLACGYVTGPLLARLLAPLLSHLQLFWLAGAVGMAGVAYWSRHPLSTKSATAQNAEQELVVESADAGLPLGRLLWGIKTSCFAVFSYGYFQAAVVLFLPLYLMESKGVPEQDTIVLPGLFCLGMLLCSNWAGKRADRWGHLLVMTVLSGLGMTCVLGFVFVHNYLVMCGLVFSAGATLAAMSPIALALTGIVVPRGQLGRANGLYNTFYASGILFGPPAASFVFARFGGAMMLFHLAALWALFVAFALLFFADDPAWRRRRVTISAER